MSCLGWPEGFNRTDRAGLHAQHPSATPYTIFGHLDADGINADGPPFCRLDACNVGRFTTDRGYTHAEFDDAKARTQTLVIDFAGINEENVTVRHNHQNLFVETVEHTKLSADLIFQIEREVGLRLCAIEPSTRRTDGVRTRFQFDDNANVLAPLTALFRSRVEQATRAKTEPEQRGNDQYAAVEHGRALAYQDAHSAVLAAQRGERDD